MKVLIQSASGRGRSLLQSLGRRYFAAGTAEYARRNYANNVAEYNSVFNSLNIKRRAFLLRDAYDDMMLDGVQPTRDSFHSLLVGTMKGARLQDGLFFKDEMKAMGLVPDVNLYNLLISTCGKSKDSNLAIQILEEMKNYGVKPSTQTYISLLNACAADGRLDRVLVIVRDMTAAGAGLNKFCYAGLITAHINKMPRTNDITTKIVELVEQSKGWSSVESSPGNAGNVLMGVTDEELYNMPTAEYVNRGGFLFRGLTVYHAAFHACAEHKDVKLMETLLEMLKKDGAPDTFITMQIMRCYLSVGGLDSGLRVFEEALNSGRNMFPEIFVTFIDGAMTDYTQRGMELAQEALVKMNARNFNLSLKQGSDLLLKAAGEKGGGYTVANLIWDLLQAKNITPFFPAMEAYYYGLKRREVPADDPRLLLVTRTYEKMRQRSPGGPQRTLKNAENAEKASPQ